MPTPFMKTTLLSEAEIAEYAAGLPQLNDDELVHEVAIHIERAAHSSIMTPSDQKVSACYREFTGRGKEYLYQRGYNRASRSCGVELTQQDVEAARAPQAA